MANRKELQGLSFELGLKSELKLLSVAYAGILKGGPMPPKVLIKYLYVRQGGVSQAGVWGRSPQPLGQFLAFLAKITPFGDHF